jgi:hypothetical protein
MMEELCGMLRFVPLSPHPSLKGKAQDSFQMMIPSLWRLEIQQHFSAVVALGFCSTTPAGSGHFFMSQRLGLTKINHV